MTIGQLLKQYPAEETELLLAHVLNKPKEFLHLHPESKVTRTQKIRFAKLYKGFKKGMPIAYLLGYKYFYGLKFAVNKSVLIPRPESEWLVDRALNYIAHKKGTVSILDMGTGSGCLAISTAKNLGKHKAEIIAVDISAKALNVARINASRNKVKIKFIKSDLFKNVKDKFDLIFANLPYVPIKSYKKLKTNLVFEPISAICTGDNTWNIYDRFLKDLPSHISHGTRVFFEIDPLQKTTLQKQFKKTFPKAQYKFEKDLRGLWRYAWLRF